MATITITGWENFQPRKDRSNHTWFRVDNTIIFSETLDGLSAEQKWFWICLLSYASRKQTPVIEFNAAYFEKHFGLSTKKMLEALKHLTDAGAVTFEPGDGVTPQDTSRLTTNKQTNNTNKQTNMPTDDVGPADFDFESLYKKYPRKEGKDEGMKRLKERNFDRETFDQFEKAVNGYIAKINYEAVEPRFIKHWSSFVGTLKSEPWRDYVEWRPSEPTHQTDEEFARRLLEKHGVSA